MKQWNGIFKKEGKVFLKPQENIPKIAKFFKKKGVKKIFDLGCGSGRHVVYFAKNGFDVYGFDAASVGIKLTKSWLKQEKLRAGLKLGSIYQKLPYEDDFFDAIIAVQVINHGKIENIRKLIKEMERILKPNGLIFITVTQKTRVKNWRINSIRKEVFCGDDGVSILKVDYKIIGPQTYVPIEGTEKGLIHYVFDKDTLEKEFKDFKIHNISLDFSGRHYCLLAELKTIK